MAPPALQVHVPLASAVRITYIKFRGRVRTMSFLSFLIRIIRSANNTGHMSTLAVALTRVANLLSTLTHHQQVGTTILGTPHIVRTVAVGAETRGTIRTTIVRLLALRLINASAYYALRVRVSLTECALRPRRRLMSALCWKRLGLPKLTSMVSAATVNYINRNKNTNK